MQRRAFLSFATLPVLSACGFKLRGDYAMPFREVAVEAPAGHPLAIELRRQLRGLRDMRVADEGGKATMRLRVIENVTEKRILSLSAGGRVREFILEQRLRFDLIDTNEQIWVEPELLTVTRDFSFNDSQALAKEGEERMLNEQMQADLVNQVLRRIQRAKVATTSR